jgi:hypothetical protein
LILERHARGVSVQNRNLVAELGTQPLAVTLVELEHVQLAAPAS